MTVASATDVVIQRKLFGLGMTTLMISNKEMQYIMEIVKSLGKSGVLLKSASETIKK